jgi:hypothetical protein
MRCPRAGARHLCSRAASGIMPAGTMTGTRGARCNRGRRRRDTPATYRRCAPRSLARCRVLGMRESLGREPPWNADRRARHCKGARCAQRHSGYGTASVGVLLPFLFGAASDLDASGQSHCRIYLTKIGVAESFWEGLSQNSGANKNAPREWESISSAPAKAREGDHANGSGPKWPAR